MYYFKVEVELPHPKTKNIKVEEMVGDIEYVHMHWLGFWGLEMVWILALLSLMSTPLVFFLFSFGPKPLKWYLLELHLTEKLGKEKTVWDSI